MTKTDGKYTYEDLLLRKRILKREIHDLEKIVTLEYIPQTLGMIGGSIKEKAMEMARNPNALNLLIDTGIGLGAELFISRYVNKKSVVGKAALMASAYLVPLVINKTKELVVRLASKKAIDSNGEEEK